MIGWSKDDFRRLESKARELAQREKEQRMNSHTLQQQQPQQQQQQQQQTLRTNGATTATTTTTTVTTTSPPSCMVPPDLDAGVSSLLRSINARAQNLADAAKRARNGITTATPLTTSQPSLPAQDNWFLICMGYIIGFLLWLVVKLGQWLGALPLSSSKAQQVYIAQPSPVIDLPSSTTPSPRVDTPALPSPRYEQPASQLESDDTSDSDSTSSEEFFEKDSSPELYDQTIEVPPRVSCRPEVIHCIERAKERELHGTERSNAKATLCIPSIRVQDYSQPPCHRTGTDTTTAPLTTTAAPPPPPEVTLTSVSTGTGTGTGYCYTTGATHDRTRHTLPLPSDPLAEMPQPQETPARYMDDHELRDSALFLPPKTIPGTHTTLHYYCPQQQQPQQPPHPLDGKETEKKCMAEMQKSMAEAEKRSVRRKLSGVWMDVSTAWKEKAKEKEVNTVGGKIKMRQMDSGTGSSGEHHHHHYLVKKKNQTKKKKEGVVKKLKALIKKER